MNQSPDPTDRQLIERAEFIANGIDPDDYVHRVLAALAKYLWGYGETQ